MNGNILFMVIICIAFVKLYDNMRSSTAIGITVAELVALMENVPDEEEDVNLRFSFGDLFNRNDNTQNVTKTTTKKKKKWFESEDDVTISTPTLKGKKKVGKELHNIGNSTTNRNSTNIKFKADFILTRRGMLFLMRTYGPKALMFLKCMGKDWVMRCGVDFLKCAIVPTPWDCVGGIICAGKSTYACSDKFYA